MWVQKHWLTLQRAHAPTLRDGRAGAVERWRLGWEAPLEGRRGDEHETMGERGRRGGAAPAGEGTGGACWLRSDEETEVIDAEEVGESGGECARDGDCALATDAEGAVGAGTRRRQARAAPPVGRPGVTASGDDEMGVMTAGTCVADDPMGELAGDTCMTEAAQGDGESEAMDAGDGDEMETEQGTSDDGIGEGAGAGGLSEGRGTVRPREEGGADGMLGPAQGRARTAEGELVAPPKGRGAPRKKGPRRARREQENGNRRRG